MASTRLLGLGGEQLAQRHRPGEALRVVDRVGVVRAVAVVAAVAPQVGVRLGDRHLRTQACVARVHQTASLVGCVGEEPGDLGAGRAVEQIEQREALIVRRRLDEVGRVVRRQQSEPRAPIRRRHGEDELRLVVRRQGEKEVLSSRAVEQRKRLETFGRVEDGPGVGDFGAARDRGLVRAVAAVRATRPYRCERTDFVRVRHDRTSATDATVRPGTRRLQRVARLVPRQLYGPSLLMLDF